MVVPQSQNGRLLFDAGATWPHKVAAEINKNFNVVTGEPPIAVRCVTSERQLQCRTANRRGSQHLDIRFISTLTAEDEAQMAPALMQAVTSLLDALPIAYTLRVETLGAQVFHHTHPSAVAEAGADIGRRMPARSINPVS